MYVNDGMVALREFKVEDIELKVSWINDPENNRYLHYDLPLEYEKTKQWFYHRDLSKRLDCVIEYDGVPVGLIGLLNLDAVNQKAEYYITMGSHAYKRKGIATTASHLILRYAFDTLKLNKVYLNVDSGNTAACALYEKIGMRCEGEFLEDLWHRDEFVDRKRYAVLRSQYLKKCERE